MGWDCCPHLAAEKTEAERLSDLPRVPEPCKGRAGPGPFFRLWGLEIDPAPPPNSFERKLFSSALGEPPWSLYQMLSKEMFRHTYPHPQTEPDSEGCLAPLL